MANIITSSDERDLKFWAIFLENNVFLCRILSKWNEWFSCDVATGKAHPVFMQLSYWPSSSCANQRP
jgi:hypothetical protein